jgi:creatinine amidohydrolase/Fe(II)-dependent formamide hydrolase-like protein
MGSDPGQASPEKGEKIVRLAVQALVADLRSFEGEIAP